MTNSTRVRNAIDIALVIGGVAFVACAVKFGWSSHELRANIAIAAVVLMLAANVPYCIDAIAGRTTPHVVTWALLGCITICAFWRQIQDGATLATTYPLLLAGVMNFVNCAFGAKQAKFTVKRSDLACAAAGVVAIVLWLVVDSPLATVVCLTFASLLAFVPTIRKGWIDPRSETFRTYPRNFVRYGLITAAVAPATFTTLLYPATWVVVNGLLAIMLWARLSRQSQPQKVGVAALIS